MQRLLQHDGAILEQRGQRPVGGDAVIETVSAEADVMAAADPRLAALAVTRRRTQAQAQRRSAGERLHDAHEHHGPEYPAARTETWREIQDAHHAAMRVVEARLENRRVAQVTLFGARQVQHVDGEHALVRVAAFLLQQRGKHRIAIRSRQTGPHQPRLFVDQRGHLAIADHAVVHGCPASCSSQ